MKFKKSLNHYKDIKTKEFFAWRPVKIKGQTRWLEKVKIEGHYYKDGSSGKLKFFRRNFIDS